MWREVSVGDSLSACMYIHVFWPFTWSVKSNQVWRLDGMKTSKHMYDVWPAWWRRKDFFISTHKTAVSFPTYPVAQPTSWVPHPLLHQSSLLTQATEPTHSGAAHRGLYKLVGLATASHCSLRRSFVLAGRQLLLRQPARWLEVRGLLRRRQTVWEPKSTA